MAAAGAGGSLGKVSTPTKIAVCVFVPFVLGLGYWIIFYNDVTTKIDSALRQQQALKTELSTQQQAQASYFADRDELALRQQRQREFNKVLPAETEVAAFLSAVQQVSNVSGVSLNAWKPEQESAQQFYAKVPMRLEMSGRFHQIVKFAYELGKVDRIINLENIDIAVARTATPSDEAQLTARCLATAFKAVQQEQKKR